MIRIMQKKVSEDGSTKYLFNDGIEENNNYEAIYFYPFDNIQESTICMSTQIGCTIGCKFCATGRLGLKRNLKSDEIIDSISLILEDQKKSGRNVEQFNSISLMGMGEPLNNYDEIRKFYNEAKEIFPAKRYSLSTSGIPNKIIQLASDETEYELFLSLHSPFTEQRTEIMPINKTFPLKQSIEACEEYYDIKAKKVGKKVTASYLLIKDINDKEEHVKELIKILNPEKFRIQILLYNENEGMPFKRPDNSVAYMFKDVLEQNKFEAVVCISKGQDIAGACGQMRGQKI